MDVSEILRNANINRFSLGFPAQARKLTQSREAAAALAERVKDMPEGDIGLMVGETIKALINDLLVDGMLEGNSPSMGMLREAAEAVQRLESARKSNVDAGINARKAVVRKAIDAIDEAVSIGQIEQAAGERAREIMGFV